MQWITRPRTFDLSIVRFILRERRCKSAIIYYGFSMVLEKKVLKSSLTWQRSKASVLDSDDSEES